MSRFACALSRISCPQVCMHALGGTPHMHICMSISPYKAHACTPCTPCTPCVPCAPCVPCDPCAPCAPCAPCTPCTPCTAATTRVNTRATRNVQSDSHTCTHTLLYSKRTQREAPGAASTNPQFYAHPHPHPLHDLYLLYSSRESIQPSSNTLLLWPEMLEGMVPVKSTGRRGMI